MNHYAEQPTFFLYGEGSNKGLVMAKELYCSRDSYLRHVFNLISLEHGRSGMFLQGKQIESDKPIKARMTGDLPEVLLTDSTLRQGEPVTWGSGQQKLNLSKET